MTRQRVHLAVLESQYVKKDASALVDSYAPNRQVRIAAQSLDCSAAQQVLEDTNAPSVLPLHDMSLLKSYVAAVRLLNQSLAVHIGILETTNFEPIGAEEVGRELVRQNAIAVVVMAQVVQEELTGFSNEALYDRDAMERIQERIYTLSGTMRAPQTGESQE